MSSTRRTVVKFTRAAVLGALFLVTLAAAASASPWASQVVRYEAGNLTAGDYTTPLNVLGEPSRTTGDSASWPPSGETVSVRVTEPAWQAAELCKIGVGGELVVGFDHQVLNSAGNPFGVDLIVFGNAGFASGDWPANNTVDASAFVFGGTFGEISVSQDNLTWYRATGLGAMFPMQAYLSDQRLAFNNGATPSDYTRPVDPALSLGDLGGLTISQVLALYDGAGGGLGVDLSQLVNSDGQAASLAWASYVRVSGATNALDGFADVAAPEPATMTLLAVGLAGLVSRRRRR